jgi:hypothetical protein
LQGRQESEVLWFQRRDTLKAATAWLTLGGLPAAMAQQRSNIVALTGDAMLNGRQLERRQEIQTGDEIQTGPGSNLLFVLGDSSFQVRQNARLRIERGTTRRTVGLLRLLTGAVLSVWGTDDHRAIIMPTLTAGVSGTGGVYAEIFTGVETRNYFCNCYGTATVTVGQQKKLSQSEYHQSFWSNPDARGRAMLTSAPEINHSDAELEFLGHLIKQRTPWQISGTKNTSGTLAS